MLLRLALALFGLLADTAVRAETAAPAKACIGVDIEDRMAHAAREVACLRELRKVASRKDNSLTVRLENGTSKTYKDEPSDGEGNISYRLVGYHPGARVYSIAIQYYEGTGVELLSARTGKVLRITGIPYFSPDGSAFIVIDNDDAYPGPYDLGAGSAANGGLSLDWRRINGSGYLQWSLQRWVDNDRIALRVFAFEDHDRKCPNADCDAMLVRFGNSWTVRRLPAKQP